MHKKLLEAITSLSIEGFNVQISGDHEGYVYFKVVGGNGFKKFCIHRSTLIDESTGGIAIAKLREIKRELSKTKEK